MRDFDFTIDLGSNVGIDFRKTREGIESLDNIARVLLVKTTEIGESMHALSNLMRTTANDSTINAFQAASDDLDMIAANLKSLDEGAGRLINKLKRLEDMM